MVKSITGRWLKNTLGVIIIILVVLVAMLSFVAQNYYYTGIQQTITGRADEFVNFFSNYTPTSTNSFADDARDYVENFKNKELMELMVIDSYGNITTTSTGFAPDETQKMPDYNQALQSKDNAATWTGNLNSGEHILALTRVIQSSSGDILGAVRYVVSLEAADRTVFLVIALLALTGLVIIFFVVISGTYFVRSIVFPVRKMSAAAKSIAQGNFDNKIDKMYDDEIGELSDSINYMAEELKNSEKLKNDFISSVSHELRTPLTAIKGWAETIQMGVQTDPTMEKGMSIIVKESERLTGLVEELLDFSRIQNGRMVLMMDKIDVLAELDEAAYMLRDRALSENKHLLYDEPDFAPPVMGDKNRLRQVFINIIDNALKYTPTSGVIAIQATHDDKFIYIKISDNGCGIPEEHLPHIKDKFYKANQTQRGSGIGLAVANEIMQLHGGSLDIESTEGIGTTVTISLPLLTEQAEETTI